jgi:hypothetical protein
MATTPCQNNLADYRRRNRERTELGRIINLAEGGKIPEGETPIDLFTVIAGFVAENGILWDAVDELVGIVQGQQWRLANLERRVGK